MSAVFSFRPAVSPAVCVPPSRLFPPVRSPSAPLPLSSSAPALSFLPVLSPAEPLAASVTSAADGGAAVFGSFACLSACMPPSPSLEERRRSVPASSSTSLPSLALPCGARRYFYFAIGSMCNPVSLLLRGIQPVPGCSVAAVLKGYRLAFHGEAGMADIQPVAADSDSDGGSYTDHFHGVLHLISEAHLAVLDRIEAGYGRKLVRVELYDGSSQAAYAYQMFDRPQPQRHGLPSERYVDIISRGCQHYGVCPEYVRWLQSLPCVPRPEQSQLLSLPLPTQPRLFTPSELAMCDGEDGRPLCIAVNNKVLQYVGEADDPLPSPLCPSSASSFSAYSHMQAEYAGRDVTYLLSLMCYEPLFPVASCAAQMSQPHRDRLEDMYVRKLLCLASFAFEAVGTLVAEPAADKSVGSDGSAESSANIDVSANALPVSPRAATLSSICLDGRRIDEFKARRRRGSLTSTIMRNVQQIIDMQMKSNTTAPADCHGAEHNQPSSDSRHHSHDAAEADDSLPDAATLASDLAALKSHSHSPFSGVSVASSTAATILSLHDFDSQLSPVSSELSRDNDEDDAGDDDDVERYSHEIDLSEMSD